MTNKKLPTTYLRREWVGHLSQFLSKFTDAEIFIHARTSKGENMVNGKIPFNLMNISLEGQTLNAITCHSHNDKYENTICDNTHNLILNLLGDTVYGN